MSCVSGFGFTRCMSCVLNERLAVYCTAVSEYRTLFCPPTNACNAGLCTPLLSVMSQPASGQGIHVRSIQQNFKARLAHLYMARLLYAAACVQQFLYV